MGHMSVYLKMKAIPTVQIKAGKIVGQKRFWQKSATYPSIYILVVQIETRHTFRLLRQPKSWAKKGFGKSR
jgi:hypothetical protein